MQPQYCNYGWETGFSFRSGVLIELKSITDGN